MSPKQIAQLMKDLGLTQQALADKIGAHRVTVADWVRGANKPKGLYLKALRDLAEKQKGKAKQTRNRG
jgi:DNA-binding transcriptional regulator YiaG